MLVDTSEKEPSFSSVASSSFSSLTLSMSSWLVIPLWKRALGVALQSHVWTSTCKHSGSLLASSPVQLSQVIATLGRFSEESPECSQIQFLPCIPTYHLQLYNHIQSLMLFGLKKHEALLLLCYMPSPSSHFEEYGSRGDGENGRARERHTKTKAPTSQKPCTG